MKMSRREQLDVRIEELKARFRKGGISEAALDREVAPLAGERAAPTLDSAPERPDGVNRLERLESAITAFCQTYLWYQPRGE